MVVHSAHRLHMPSLLPAEPPTPYLTPHNKLQCRLLAITDTPTQHSYSLSSTLPLELPLVLVFLAYQVHKSVTHVLSGSCPRRRSLSSRHASAVFES